MSESTYNPKLHLLAVLTAGATFPLIFMGGLVTSHGAGMSVPDWPNSYGYNMFLFPPSQWVGGIFYEHTHRLMGTVVGMLSIALTIAAWKWEPRRHVRWLCTGVLAAVIFQGVLGGLRVVWVNLDLAVVHACFAQAFFCLAALAALMTSKWWIREGEASAEPILSRSNELLGGSFALPVVAIVCVVVIYAQLIVGAMMRHDGAGLAIPDLPLAYGKVLPPTNAEELAAANATRMELGDTRLGRVTLQQVWLHFGHRVGAVLATIAVIAAAWMTLRKSIEPALRRPAWLMLILLLAQLTLGVLTVLMRKPADIASLHVAVGALLLVTTFVLAARSIKHCRTTGASPVSESTSIRITSETPVVRKAVIA